MRALTVQESEKIARALAKALEESLPKDLEILGYPVAVEAEVVPGPSNVSWRATVVDKDIEISFTRAELTMLHRLHKVVDFRLTLTPYGATEQDLIEAYSGYAKILKAIS